MNKEQLIESLRKNGFSKPVLDAFEKVKREDFIPEDWRESAYDDNPIPIGFGATISQPYTIAFMLDLLELDKLDKKPESKILEIGSGSGYVLALIDEICKNCGITGLERIGKLAERSRGVLEGNKNIKIIHGSNIKNIANKEGFDRILVSASAEKEPREIIEKLKDNGILVIPIRDSIFQFKKENGKISEKEFYGFVFVPLVEE
jgi:protein-L-isoaspartate(D-aspartate) O-methyltransferase